MSINEPDRDHEIIPVHVITLVENPDKPVLYLYCQGANKIIQVFIGKPEAKILAMALDKAQFDRPLTHNLLLDTINALSGEIRQVVIYDVENGTFHAKVCIQMYDKLGLLMEVQVEARPSDALILAVLGTKPIFVTDTVLEKAGEENPLGPRPIEEQHLTEKQIEDLKLHLQQAQEREQNP